MVCALPLLPQPHPNVAVLSELVLNPNGERRADPRGGINHEPDQCLVAQPNRRAGIDAVEPHPRFCRFQHGRLAGARHVGRPVVSTQRG